MARNPKTAKLNQWPSTAVVPPNGLNRETYRERFDAIQETLGGPLLVLPEPRPPISTGERRLMADMLLQAIEESMPGEPSGTVDRKSAQAWLGDEPGFTAREACEYIGIDYGAMMTVLRKRWSAA